jgi:hypothetical protein
LELGTATLKQLKALTAKGQTAAVPRWVGWVREKPHAQEVMLCKLVASDILARQCSCCAGTFSCSVNVFSQLLGCRYDKSAFVDLHNCSWLAYGSSNNIIEHNM